MIEIVEVVAPALVEVVVVEVAAVATYAAAVDVEGVAAAHMRDALRAAHVRAPAAGASC